MPNVVVSAWTNPCMYATMNSLYGRRNGRMLETASLTTRGREATKSICRDAKLCAYAAFATYIVMTGSRAAVTPFIGEPERRPPTKPAIIGPAGWTHHSRKERMRMIREDDQKENGGPSPWKRFASPSTSIR